MNPSKKKSHGGNRGFSHCADIEGGSGAEHSPLQVSALFLARVAADAAKAQLDIYALTTDTPAPCLVEAADLLDAAAQRLAELSAALNGDAVKGWSE